MKCFWTSHVVVYLG